MNGGCIQYRVRNMLLFNQHTYFRATEDNAFYTQAFHAINYSKIALA